MVDYDELKLELKKMRDELSLRMHLASMEAKDEWDELEGKWRRFNSQADMGRTAEGATERASEASHAP